MKSPAEHDVVQIDLTNACSLSCSNCTRFCGHYTNHFFMDFETFKKAVDSMEGHTGLIGIMGGEPTLHPEFEKFVEYYASKLGPRTFSRQALQPIKKFNEHIVGKDLLDIGVKRGLWTMLGKRYADNYELIQEVFDCQYINDHKHDGTHQALLITRKELGIPDDEWIKLRDNCWIQNYWSPSITPKGAFFCEVAGALDTLFKGPGGWPIEPGWWKRKPEDFGDQLQWCEMCSGALKVPRTQANTEIDDISPKLLSKLKEVNSPKIGKKKYKLFDSSEHEDTEYEIKPGGYMPDDEHILRVNQANQSLFIRKLNAIVVLNEDEDHLDVTLPINRSHFDKFVIVAKQTSSSLEDIAEKHECLLVIPKENESCGQLINRSMENLPFNDWLITLDSNIILSDKFRDKINEWVFNPGVLHIYPVRYNIMHHDKKEEAFRKRNVLAYMHDPTYSYKNRKFDVPFYLFNRRARSLKGVDSLFSSDSVNYYGNGFKDHWPDYKQIFLSNLS